MQIAMGEHVRSQDGQDIGRVKYLVLDPPTGQVKKIVVEKDLFLPDDVELPVEALQGTEGDHLLLRLTTDQLKAYPRFDPSQYIGPPPEAPYPTIGSPFGGFLWPLAYPATSYMPGIYPVPIPLPQDVDSAGNPIPNEVVERERQEDLANAVLSADSDVVTQDGQKIGEIDRVLFDAATGRPTALRVRKGFLFPKEVEIPADLIASADDDVITLTITKEQAEKLRE
ncbi:MAG TPA: PRC-barrel domain-containing protein [Chthonomonadaceae bacterium]|nr:PRC-barrel domain-containing protein [Chthonomonadaceae bacterium]